MGEGARRTLVGLSALPSPGTASMDARRPLRCCGEGGARGKLACVFVAGTPSKTGGWDGGEEGRPADGLENAPLSENLLRMPPARSSAPAWVGLVGGAAVPFGWPMVPPPAPYPAGGCQDTLLSLLFLKEPGYICVGDDGGESFSTMAVEPNGTRPSDGKVGLLAMPLVLGVGTMDGLFKK